MQTIPPNTQASVGKQRHIIYRGDTLTFDTTPSLLEVTSPYEFYMETDTQELYTPVKVVDGYKLRATPSLHGKSRVYTFQGPLDSYGTITFSKEHVVKLRGFDWVDSRRKRLTFRNVGLFIGIELIIISATVLITLALVGVLFPGT